MVPGDGVLKGFDGVSKVDFHVLYGGTGVVKSNKIGNVELKN